MKVTYANHYHNETENYTSDIWTYLVESSSLSYVSHHLWISHKGYGEVSELTVKFTNGSMYSYEGVPVSVVLSLISADSIGKAFHQLIKKGGYAYKKVKDADPKPTADLSEGYPLG
jgi:chloramphenicol O-acetyltransferase